MSALETWVPVALSASLEPSTSSGVVINGAELAVWRDSKGAAHVWEDRCPHRGMRMSFGFVRGDHIACLYHGWEYDTAGLCQYIPAHPELDVPKTIKVATFACAERHGLIWTRALDGADEASIPALGELTGVRSIYVEVAADAVREKLENATLLPNGAATTVETPGAGCFALAAGGLEVIVATQPLSPKKTGLHILVGGTPDAVERKAVARWAEGLRLSLENAAFANAEAEFA